MDIALSFGKPFWLWVFSILVIIGLSYPLYFAVSSNIEAIRLMIRDIRNYKNRKK
jgi:hypothetical protein